MNVKPRAAIASSDECLTRGPNVRFEVLELFVVCIGFTCFRGFVLVLVFAGFVFRAGSFAKAKKRAETHHDCRVCFDCLRLCCKNPSIVIQSPSARTLYADTPSTRQDVTQSLDEWSGGDEGALEKLVPLVQPELQRLAHHYMSRERAGQTLQTTAILNEACLWLIDNAKPVWQGRTHFIGAAAQLIGRIMVDHARERQSLKRGGALKVTLDEAALLTETQSQEILDLESESGRWPRPGFIRS